MFSLRLFLNYSPTLTLFGVVTGALSGLVYSFLIPLVMQFLSDDRQSEFINLLNVNTQIPFAQAGLVFVFLCLLIFVLRSVSQIVLANISLNVRFKLRKDFYSRIQNASIEGVEGVGSSRLLQTLSTDIEAVQDVAELLPLVLTNTVTIAGMFAYLAYLDFSIFLLVLQIIVVGVVFYQVPLMIGRKYFIQSRDHKDGLQEAFRGLVHGAKELKLNHNKRKNFTSSVLHSEETKIKELEIKGITIYNVAGNFGDLIAFSAIGALCFILMNYQELTASDVLGAVMVLLYITGPISGVLNSVPVIIDAGVSLRKMKQLDKELSPEKFNEQIQPVGSWQSFSLKDTVYTYKGQDKLESAFSVGPVSLTLHRGEITFITGGNGSGKTTLAKMISQHYLPDEGLVFFDNTEITAENLASFREEVCCIYSDYYLFDRLLDIDIGTEEQLAQVNHLLEVFRIDNKVSIVDGHFSTLKLSDGQRRRLALVVAVIENKSLLLFDEWAADQDPEFKDLFYKEILPYLRSLNKAVVIISHDDRYFELADQLIVMESGLQVEPYCGGLFNEYKSIDEIA